ncbi:hypothetical protein Ciccas_000959 [Cichlidogyrus casuarinus]|uniref:Uncharacterized protein n=1 Tax=Cichlidogyrus casuarinus TaxID=1844966 RepID=A0ABD2QLF8_9PLAT
MTYHLDFYMTYMMRWPEYNRVALSPTLTCFENAGVAHPQPSYPLKGPVHKLDQDPIKGKLSRNLHMSVFHFGIASFILLLLTGNYSKL